jgi:3-dehydroquinate synthetase/shikimate kinase
MSSGVVLVGLSGSGKSTLGACLAERLGRPFIDLDVLVHDTTGLTSAEHIERHGEAAFRSVESGLVKLATASHGAVIASGGGTVVDPSSRWRLWDHGVTVWLDAPDARLLDRLAASDESRPLLSGDPMARLATLRRDREPFYRAADVRLDADRPIEALADEVIRALSVAGPSRARRLFDATPLRHHPVGPERARVVLGRDLDTLQFAEVLGPLATDSRPSLIADERAARHVPELVSGVPHHRRVDVDAGESAKRLSRLETILEWLAAERAERGDAVIAVGGGSVGDLAGFAAAVYLRGVPLVHVPTTWLAQADSSIGGKVAVDLARAKNAVGATWPAWAVIADASALRALPEARLRDGYAESIKAGLIGDPDLWQLAESAGRAGLTDEPTRYVLLERSVRLKLAVVDRDPYETGERRTLNLGHTIGHALEIESGYRLPHGAAVALGLRAVASISERRGAEAGLADRIDGVLRGAGFELHRAFDPGAVKAALASDKKRARGRQRWILPMAVGTVVEADDVTDGELDRALDTIRTIAG